MNKNRLLRCLPVFVFALILTVSIYDTARRAYNQTQTVYVFPQISVQETVPLQTGKTETETEPCSCDDDYPPGPLNPNMEEAAHFGYQPPNEERSFFCNQSSSEPYVWFPQKGWYEVKNQDGLTSVYKINTQYVDPPIPLYNCLMITSWRGWNSSKLLENQYNGYFTVSNEGNGTVIKPGVDNIIP